MGRKLIAVAVAAALALGMASCGKSEPPPDKRSDLRKSADSAGKAIDDAAHSAKKSIEGEPKK